MAEIGAKKRKETEGRPSKETVVTNDHSLVKHNTKKIIAEAAGVSTGQIAKAEIVKREAQDTRVITNDKPSIQHNTQKVIAEAAGVSTGQIAKAEIVKREAPELLQP